MYHRTPYARMFYIDLRSMETDFDFGLVHSSVIHSRLLEIIFVLVDNGMIEFPSFPYSLFLNGSTE